MRIRERYIWIGILCLYFILVLALCLLRPETIPQFRPELWGIPTDKIAHFLMFLPYPTIAYMTFRPQGGRKSTHILVLLTVFAAGVMLAFGTEHIQGISAYRSYEIEDFYADVLGMECSVLLTSIYILLKKKTYK